MALGRREVASCGGRDDMLIIAASRVIDNKHWEWEALEFRIGGFEVSICSRV